VAIQSGLVSEIVRDCYGKPKQIVIKKGDASSVNIHTLNDYDALVAVGLLSFIKERPYNMAINPEDKRKLVINAMNSAPNQADAKALCKQCFRQMQLAYRCLKDSLPEVYFFCKAGERIFWEHLGVENIIEVSGGHPAGNASVHLAALGMENEQVWTLRAVHLAMMGDFLEHRQLPSHRWVSVTGHDVEDGFYYLPIGCNTNELKKLCCENNLMVFGDLLTGRVGNALASDCAEIVFIRNEEKGLPLCSWLTPRFSVYAKFLNPILKLSKKVNFSTQVHGGERAMVFNNIYDKVMPLDIKMDFLVRALLKKDLSEALSLGLSEIVPEDVALCEFLCPSKLPLQQLVKDAQLRIVLGEVR
ncbi:MAG: hypothetical protein ACRC37_05465, partial [Lentisphaeria bacterium]